MSGSWYQVRIEQLFMYDVLMNFNLNLLICLKDNIHQVALYV